MEKILEELESIPGVMGSYVYHPKEGIIAKKMPSVFKDQKLIDIGKLLIKIHTSSRSNFPDLTEVSFFYEEYLIRDAPCLGLP